MYLIIYKHNVIQVDCSLIPNQVNSLIMVT